MLEVLYSWEGMFEVELVSGSGFERKETSTLHNGFRIVELFFDIAWPRIFVGSRFFYLHTLKIRLKRESRFGPLWTLT